jgi:hypothetical protein
MKSKNKENASILSIVQLFQEQDERNNMVRIAEMKKELLEDPKMPVSKAVVIIEASDEFVNARKQKAKVEQVFEFIRITKKMATMKDTEMNL